MDKAVINKKKKKIGLALGGGAARGVAHLGVLKAFDDAGIKFDFIAGTSAGSMVGAGCAAGLTWLDMLQFIKSVSTRDILKWQKWGIGYNSEAIAQLTIRAIGDCTFSELKLPFSAVAVDVKKGVEIVLNEGLVSEAVRASCSVPGVFSSVVKDDMVLVDGGVLNNVPANVARQMGADIVIGVDLNYDSDMVVGEGYFEVLYAVFNIMVRNNTLLGRSHADIMISPNLSSFAFHKLHRIDEMFELGEIAAKNTIPQIKRILKS